MRRIRTLPSDKAKANVYLPRSQGKEEPSHALRTGFSDGRGGHRLLFPGAGADTAPETVRRLAKAPLSQHFGEENRLHLLRFPHKKVLFLRIFRGWSWTSCRNDARHVI